MPERSLKTELWSKGREQTYFILTFRPEYVYTMNLAHELFNESMVTDLLKEASKGEHPPTYGVFDVDKKTGKKVPRGTCWR